MKLPTRLFFLIFLVIGFPAKAEVPAVFWDGSYSSELKFKMGGASLCSMELPIKIYIEVKDLEFKGRIENLNETGHPYCQKYHEGAINGILNTDGSFLKFRITQDDIHSKQYSSYKAEGSLSDARLISRAVQFHPVHSFVLLTPQELQEKQTASSTAVAVAEVGVSQTTVVVQPAASAVQPVQSATAVVQPAASAVQPSVSVGDASAQQVQQVNRTMSPAEAQIMIDEVHARITLYNVIADVIKDKPRSRQARVLGIVDGEIARLRAEKAILEALLSQRFSTPIRPSNANLSVSAFRAADTFPKIPYYVPGTNEFGEMLIVPRVSDAGALNYEFDFIDPVSSYAKVRDRIVVPHDEIEKLINGLEKVDEWTTVAQENNITRRVSKVASCFPEMNCGEKAVGKSSTEVVFQIYEDGATSGRIQRNKGQYVVGYNMSVESSILLGAYLIYMEEAGAKEFNIGVMTDDQVLELFD
jgi:hypothetical protein